MADINTATVVGRLGRDPELKSTQGGTSYCRLNIATNRRRKVGDEWQDETDWHRVTVWGKQAESCAQYLSKGRQVAVTGRLQSGSYDKDGTTVYTYEIVANDVQFLGYKGDSESPSGGDDPPDYKPMSEDNSDIPF